MTPADLQAIRIRAQARGLAPHFPEDDVFALLAEVDRLRAWAEKQKKHGNDCASFYFRPAIGDRHPCNCEGTARNAEIDRLLGVER